MTGFPYVLRRFARVDLKNRAGGVSAAAYPVAIAATGRSGRESRQKAIIEPMDTAAFDPTQLTPQQLISLGQHALHQLALRACGTLSA